MEIGNKGLMSIKLTMRKTPVGLSGELVYEYHCALKGLERKQGESTLESNNCTFS